ncbi:hypothetical protein [Mycobacteroides abscessus]|uniref:hypothetical protein n=1 Tax=Mycobacteroides abscessus TaxID=36809 RepID=UPI0012FFE19A|nr:hypothetical protein [Mycobacteroides abscessus]
MAKNKDDWAALEKEYTPAQIRLLRRVAKHGLRGALYVPSPESLATSPHVVK